MSEYFGLPIVSGKLVNSALVMPEYPEVPDRESCCHACQTDGECAMFFFGGRRFVRFIVRA